MVLKDLIPKEMEEELRKMIKIKAVKESYQDCKNYVMQEARTLEEREMRRKDQKHQGSQDGLCNGMKDDDDKQDDSGDKTQQYPSMDWLGGKPEGGKQGGKGGWRFGGEGKGEGGTLRL